MNKIMNTKFWLIIIAFMHTILGILMPMLEYGNIDNLGIFLYFLVLSVHLFYVIIFTKNQTQNKLSVILCAPMVIWFVISSIMKLEMFGFPGVGGRCDRAASKALSWNTRETSYTGSSFKPDY